MKLSAELLFLLTCVYQSFGFLHIDLRRSSKRYLPQLYNAIDTTDPLPEGFEIDGTLLTRPTKPKQPIPVSSISQLKDLIYQGYRVQDLDVRGDTSRNITDIHPVVLALHRRKDLKIEPTSNEFRSDGFKIAIAIEGGGMRGCVAAGIVSALPHLGLSDSVDVVYGSSAGSLVGAYFIGKQLPYFGPEVYYDVLTSAGKEFIDAQAILRSCGLGLFDLRVDSLISLYKDRLGKPVLSLDYLMDTIVTKLKPLDWTVFWQKQKDETQVLKVVASGLLLRKAVVMSAAKKNFQTLEELTQCMRASMLLPGVTGEVVRLKGTQAEGDNIEKTWWREWSNRQDSKLVQGGEPMSDAVVFEPIPYRSALRENCTHVIAVRTRADNVSVTVKMSVMEKLIMTRFFGRKQGMPELLSWMLNQYHKLVYAEDVLLLNDYNRDYNVESDGPKILCIALPAGTVPEVQRFETSRSVIFNSVRQGFAAGYDSLVLDPTLRGKGWEVAKSVYPDSILDQIPSHLILQIQREQEVLDSFGKNSEANSNSKKDEKNKSQQSSESEDDESKDEDDESKLEKEVEREVKKEEEIEEAEFVRWFGSLKDEEGVQPKEEAVQEAFKTAVGSKLSTSKREALLSGLKRLQAIILGFGVPNIVIEKTTINTDSLILSPTAPLVEDSVDEDHGGEEGFYF